MITVFDRLRLPDKYLYTFAVISLVLLAEALAGRMAGAGQGPFVMALLIAGLGSLLVLSQMYAAILVLLILTTFTLPALYTIHIYKMDAILVMGFAIFGALILRLAHRKTLKMRSKRLYLAKLAVVIAWLLSVLASYVSWDIRVPTERRLLSMALSEVGQIVLAFAIAIAVVEAVKTRKQVQVLVGVLLVSYTWVNARYLPQYFVSVLPAAESWLEARLPGPVDVIPLVVALSLALLLFAPPRGLVRAGLLFILALNVLMGILVASPVMQVALPLAILMVIFPRSKKGFLALLLPTVALVALVLTWFDLPSDPSLSRIPLAGAGFQMFLAHPLFGVGPSNYRLYAADVYYPAQLGPSEGLTNPHNGLIYLLGSVGLVGFLAWLWLATVVLKQPRDLFREAGDGFSKALGLGVLTYLVVLLLNSAIGRSPLLLPGYGLGSLQYVSHIWIMVGLVIKQRQFAAEQSRT